MQTHEHAWKRKKKLMECGCDCVAWASQSIEPSTSTMSGVGMHVVGMLAILRNYAFRAIFVLKCVHNDAESFTTSARKSVHASSKRYGTSPEFAWSGGMGFGDPTRARRATSSEGSRCEERDSFSVLFLKALVMLDSRSLSVLLSLSYIRDEVQQPRIKPTLRDAKRTYSVVR